MKKRIAIVLAAVMVLLAFVAIAAARAEKCDCGGTMRLVGDSDVFVYSYKTTCIHGKNGTPLGDSEDWVYVYNVVRTWQCPDCGYGYSSVIGTKEVWDCHNGGN